MQNDEICYTQTYHMLTNWQIGSSVYRMASNLKVNKNDI